MRGTTMRRRDVLVLGTAWSGLAAAPAILAPTARAQSKYPDRPIKLVVPFVPGGVNDAVARLWADRVKAPLGAVFIENQGGAGGAVGAAPAPRCSIRSACRSLSMIRSRISSRSRSWRPHR